VVAGGNGFTYFLSGVPDGNQLVNRPFCEQLCLNNNRSRDRLRLSAEYPLCLKSREMLVLPVKYAFVERLAWLMRYVSQNKKYFPTGNEARQKHLCRAFFICLRILN